MKKILSLLIAVLIVAIAASVQPDASALVTTSGNIYFRVPDSWENYEKVYCHLWEKGGDDLYAWQTRNERATRVSDGLYSYSVPPNANVNMVIWSNDVGVMTYGLTMGDCCIGDTAYSKNEIVPYPYDNSKTMELIYWEKHTEYGPEYMESADGTSAGQTADPEAVVCPYSNSDKYSINNLPNLMSESSPHVPIRKLSSLGDVDLDGEVTLTDVVELQKFIAGLIQLTVEQLNNGNVIFDGTISLEDVVHIQKYKADLMPTLLTGEYFGDWLQQQMAI